MNVLLAPHADDETLFAAYTLLRHRPLVILCLQGAARHGDPDVRAAELADAMALLGCDWDDVSRAADLENVLSLYTWTADHVWAPLPEPGGNSGHNKVGELAAKLWPRRVTFYATYTNAGRTITGEPVQYEQWWPGLKRNAMACYRSQLAHPGTRPHFERPLDEYVVSGEAARAVEAQLAAAGVP